MVKFIAPSVPKITYGKEDITNWPVNLALCTCISKSVTHWYPDITGKPTIEFDGCNRRWTYYTKSERDADFDRVLSIAQEGG